MAEDAPTLLSINARDPDGLDTSWLFDVDFSPLRGRRVLITGDRAYDLAVRLEVNEVPFEHVRTFAEARRGGAAGPARGDRQLHRVPGHPSGAGPCQLRALRIVWVYPDLLSTYGDRGNLLILARRARPARHARRDGRGPLRPAAARRRPTSTCSAAARTARRRWPRSG